MNKDTVLWEFTRICDIPRPSGHEQAIAAYLHRRLEEFGYEAMIDDQLNVIAEIPATAGQEQVPVTILQAHTDMVCVADIENSEYDPATDPIKPIIDGKKMRAIGTSLGADDGIGVAMILGLLQEEFPHGPLRVIFTANEEAGMDGAANLDARHCQGEYMINCDWEEAGSVCIGCAGTVTCTFKRPVTWQQPPGDSVALVLEIGGLKGGHSGVEIHEGRANGIKVLGCFGDTLRKRGVPFTMAAFQSGGALNVIAPHAEGVFVVAKADHEAFIDIFESFRMEFVARYDKIEEEFFFACRETAMPDRTITAEDTSSICGLIAALPQGVESMSAIEPGLVETSSNLGLISLEEKIYVGVLSRSSDRQRLESIFDSLSPVATTYGFTAQEINRNPCWPPAASSRLAEAAKQLWHDRHKKTLQVMLLHAGLECGYFALKNPSLDIIALGPTMHDVHSPEETLYTDTIVPTVTLMMDLLSALCK